MGEMVFHPKKSSGLELGFQKSQVYPNLGNTFVIRIGAIALKKEIYPYMANFGKGQASVATHIFSLDTTIKPLFIRLLMSL